MPIDSSLLAILACPKCRGPLESVRDPEGFVCRTCALLYRVEDDIPNFLIDEATAWPAGK
mgnify:CR=1 FL=1